MDRFIHFSRVRFVYPLLILALILTGCGKRTLPTPATEEPPPQVRDLGAQVQPKGVELSWSAPERLVVAARESGYRLAVLRSELNWEGRNCLDCPAPNMQEVDTIQPAYATPQVPESRKFTWIDTAVSTLHAYRYQIAIQDRRGHAVSLSNPVIAKVVPPPAAPTHFVAASEPQGILLQWKASNKDDQGQALQGILQFQVERHGPNAPWEKVSTVPVSGNTFLDPAVASNQSYDYRVVPVLLFEETPVLGAPSAVQHVTAPDAIPPPPPNKVWVIPAKGTLEVHWTESQAKVAGYHVYRREGKEIIRLTATPVQGPPYVDRTAKRNNVYFYAVSAVGSQPDQKEGLLSKWAEIRAVLFE